MEDLDMRASKHWHSLRLITACLLAVGGARVLIAACQEECSEGTCFRIDGDCWGYEETHCRSGDIWAENDYGAVGGGCSQVVPLKYIDEWKFNTCNRECGKDKSRALTSDGQTTCDGEKTDESGVVKMYCKS
jgi:hypothetical protein